MELGSVRPSPTRPEDRAKGRKLPERQYPVGFAADDFEDVIGGRHVGAVATRPDLIAAAVQDDRAWISDTGRNKSEVMAKPDPP